MSELLPPLLKRYPRRSEMLHIINKVIISHPFEIYNYIMIEISIEHNDTINTMPILEKSLSRSEIITFIHKFANDNIQLLYNIIKLYAPEFI